MDKDYIIQLIKDYREAEETEEWDEFGEKHGDYDEIVEDLISFIEKEIL